MVAQTNVFINLCPVGWGFGLLIAVVCKLVVHA